MATNNKKSWKNSEHKRDYIKIALLTLTTPANVYRIVHLSHSSTMRERMVREKLLQYGILRNSGNSQPEETINLEEKHI